jgi:glycosyltransferase involved in cell wall biosynthesis
LYEVHAIELAATQRLYQWQPVPSLAQCPLTTLFSGALEDAGFLRVAKSLWAVLNRVNPDVLLVPGYASAAILAAAWAKRHGRVSILMSESNYNDHRRSQFREWIKSQLIQRLFDAATVGGKEALNYLCKLGMRESVISRFYDVVDNTFYGRGCDDLRRSPQPEQQSFPIPYFLYVGRLAPEKNVATLLQAFAKYRCRGGQAELIVVGDGALRHQLEAEAHLLGVANATHFPGHKTTDELLPFYAFAMALILPSTREPWGLVVNEAMASGLPVVVSNRCGCRCDLVRPGENGFLFSPTDAENLAQHLMLLTNLGQQERAALGQRSREIIAEYTPQAWVKSLAQVLPNLSN